jgi:hypothetical protein
MYNKIYDFCKVRNEETYFQIVPILHQGPILNKLIGIEGIPYELDKFFTSRVTGYNIILKGTSVEWLSHITMLIIIE